MSVATVVSPPAEQLTVKGEATAVSAAALRDRVAEWLRAWGMTAAQISDIQLAVNEALANCVDHAYVDHASVGEMAVRADYEPVHGCLSVCVTDHGSWRRPSALRPADQRRGRGVSLMHALVHHCTINGRPDGTTVCLDYRCR